MSFSTFAQRAATALTLALACTGAVAEPRVTGVKYYIPPLISGAANSDPLLANGVSIGQQVATYMSAGIGPARLCDDPTTTNTPQSYIPCGALPSNVTITQAQSENALERIKENLEANGLKLEDVTFMRVYLQKADSSATRADYAGWNKAYRKYFANVDLVTGYVIQNYEPVAYANARRPARVNLEVASLPLLGWLVEIEVIAAYPNNRRPH